MKGFGCGLLVLATVLVYAQVGGHDFVNIDDGLYITENRTVQQGLGLRTAAWAIVNTDAFLWHPLTWLSYLLDYDLYGVESAGPWLWTNLIWHVASSLALVAALSSLTGRFWPSLFVAGLFALHPIQVEPVAWASGRKEVLSGFFLVLTLLAYTRYARQGSHRRLVAVAGTMLLCLSAKGTHVALPLLLLLLDYWPLGRLRLGTEPGRDRGGEAFSGLIVEKAGLLALSLAVMLLSMALVSAVYSPWIADPPLGERIVNGAMAYAATLGRLFWPEALAVEYPTRPQMGLPQVGWLHFAGVVTALTAIALLFAAAGRRRGYLLVGWLWFLGMLFPMIGLVPSGLRVMHDRYAYVPMIGIAIVIGFGAADLVGRLRVPRVVVALAAVALLALCAARSSSQVGVWRDSLTLFDHALAVTERNAIVHYFRGNVLAERGDLESARRDFESALAIFPVYPDAHHSLGRLHLRQKRADLALPHLRDAIEARPHWPAAFLNLGDAEWLVGEKEQALASFERAVSQAPQSADAHHRLAVARHETGRLGEAADGYREALQIDPSHASAARALARLQEEER